MNTPNEILENLQIHQLGYLVLRIVWPEALANMRRAVIWCTLDSPEKVLQLFLIASFLSSFLFFSLFFLNSNNKRTKTTIWYMYHSATQKQQCNPTFVSILFPLPFTKNKAQKTNQLHFYPTIWLPSFHLMAPTWMFQLPRWFEYNFF